MLSYCSLPKSGGWLGNLQAGPGGVYRGWEGERDRAARCSPRPQEEPLAGPGGRRNERGAL